MLLSCAIVAGVFGFVLGRVLDVLVHRLSAGLPLVLRPGVCSRRGATAGSSGSVPVVSWPVLRGRCRDGVGSARPRRLPVELGTAVLFALVVWRFWPCPAGAATDVRVAVAGVPTLLAFLYLAAISVVLALVDLNTRRLPNAVVLPSYLVGVLLLGASALIGRDVTALATALIGAAAAFAFYFLLALASPGGMGFGDVKLAGVLGLFLGHLGWAQLVVGVVAAFLLGGLFALVLVVARRARRRSGIAFGPWMLAGAWLGVAVGGPVAGSYLSLAGLIA